LAETVDEITATLIAWIGSILPDVSTSAQPLGTRERKTGVDLRLMRVVPRAVPRTSERPAIVDLDYLITLQLSDASAEQHAVVELLFAAIGRKDFEIVADRDIAELCTGLGISIAPGFVLRTPLVRAPKPEHARRVRQPLVVHTAVLGVIEGRVVGPQDIPVANAVVSAVGLNHSVHTDRGGRFRMVGVPGGEASVALTARARGAEISGVATVGQTVVLRLPLEV
jgi:hypothetical protein